MNPWEIGDREIDPRALLGDFTTDLWFPRYSGGVWGGWTVRAIMLAASRGYWGDLYRMDGTVMLLGPGPQTDAAWMSMTPSEVESQEVGLAAARGHTVVLGLGMGWLAANAALKDEVERVTVVERDPDVIALIEAQNVFGQLPAHTRDKVSIVQADALEWRPDAPVDTLQADIWLSFLEDAKCAEAQRMQRNIAAEAVYFWGQEMELWRLACRQMDAEPETLDRATWDSLAAELDLPLITPDWPDFGDKVARAGRWWARRGEYWWRQTATAA